MYESVKDVFSWEGIRAKNYIKLLMDIGTLTNLDDKKFDEVMVKRDKQSSADLAEALKKAFKG